MIQVKLLRLKSKDKEEEQHSNSSSLETLSSIENEQGKDMSDSCTDLGRLSARTRNYKGGGPQINFSKESRCIEGGSTVRQRRPYGNLA